MSLTLALKAMITSTESCEEIMAHYAENGNEKYLDQLLDRCADDLYHFITTLSDPEIAKDVCQITWLKVINKRHSFKTQQSFKGWLFTMARNTMIDELRKQKRHFAEELNDNLCVSYEPKNTLTLDFDTALEQLSFVQKEAVVLQLEGFSLTDIATITGEGQETIKSRLRYARKNLQLCLEKDLE